jgi:glyoxylase-like metal-dependent hydrolase (beta-lactamase superfamily II)
MLLGCSSSNSAAPVAIHHYASDEGGIFANAYLVEGENGVIAIDATLTVSQARALEARLDSIGKPLVGVLITHGHPDHYNGLTILTEDQAVPIYALAGVDAVVRRDDAAKEAQWKPVFGDEWPSERRFPTHVLADGERVQLAEMSFVVHDVGPGESHHDSYWVLEGAEPVAFIGDLVFDGVHSYVSDGHTGEWLALLDALEPELKGVATLYPGHGAPGDIELIDRQRKYLQLYRETVRRLAAGSDKLDDSAKAELTRVMSEHLGSEKLAFLVGLGADVVAAELLRE